MALTDFVQGRTNRIILGSTAGIGIIVATLASLWGNPLPAYRVENNEGERMFEVSDHGAIGVGTGSSAWGTAGQVLTSGGGSGKLMSWSTVSGGAGGTTNTGGLMLIFDNRYVNTSGDVMTGALTVHSTVSGSILHGKEITSSGSLSWEDNASGSSLWVSRFAGANLIDCDVAGSSKLLWDITTQTFSCGTDAGTAYTFGGGLGLAGTHVSLNASISGSLLNFQTVSGSTLYAKNSLTSSGSVSWEGIASGSSLWVSRFSGAGLTSCNAATSTLLWNSTSSQFECGTDADTTYMAGQGITLAGTTFSLTANHSGSTIQATTTLASSGSLAWEGAASGASIFVARFAGANLTDCDAATATLNWDITTQTFSCGTDSDTTYSVGQGLTLNGTSISLTANHSGSVIRATTTLASSGAVVWETAASGASIWIARMAGAGLADCDVAGTSKLLWDVTTSRFSCGTDTDTTYKAAQGLTLANGSFSLTAAHSGSVIKASTTLASSGTLVWEGAASGASLWISRFAGAGLADCDAATSTLAWDITTSKFSCGTDSDTTYTVGQGLTLTSTVITLSAAHSGSVIKASATLASSGTLVAEGVTTLNGVTTVHAALSGASLYVSGMPQMRRIVVIPLCDGATACAVGSGSTFRIPNMLNGYTLSGATLDASIPGVTGTMSVNVYNQVGNCYLFSTAISLDTTEQTSDTAATPYVKTAGCKVFTSGQRLVPQITAIQTTAAKGVSLTLDLIP